MGLQVWLPLNGNLNNQGLADVSVTSGTAKYKTGKIGNGLDLSSRIMFSCPKLVGLKQFTIMFWVKIEDDDSIASNWQDIFGIYEQKADGSSYGQFRAETYYTPKTVGFLGVHWHDNTNYGITSGTLPTHYTGDRGVWHHCAIVVDSDQFIKSYTDGVLKNEYTTGLEGGHLYNGVFWLGETNNIAGCVNDVRIYDHTLSPREVKEISKGLVLHYPLAMPGGENLLKNSLTNFPDLWSGSGDGRTLTTQSGVSVPEWGCTDALRVYGISGASNALCLLINNSSHGLTVPSTSVSGQKYTPSIYIKNNHQNAISIAFNGMPTSQLINQGEIKKVILKATGDGNHYLQFNIYASGVNKEYDFTFWHPKIELGEVCTPWVPASTDSLYSAMGFNDGIEYDVSGYNHNGTKHSITYDSDTPRYQVCSVLDGTSYIKIDTNEWMVSGAQALTWSLWAYSDDWIAERNGGRLISCTESGGFDLEGGASGYLRVPFYVFKDSEGSSKGYVYYNSSIQLASLTPGWHLFTTTYSTSEINTYVDGVLTYSYSYTSYGIGFNKNARLYLGCEANSANPSGPYFKGKLSDFRLFYSTLSAQDVYNLYTVGASLSDTGVLFSNEVSEV